MAATPIWIGTTNGNFLTATNWSTGVAPVSTDTVIVPKGATVAIDAGLDNPTVDLAALYVEDGCTIDIGLSTAPLVIGLGASGVVDLAGTGTIYLEIAGDLSTNTVTVPACGTLYLTSSGAEELCDDLNITATSGEVYVAWGNDELAEIDNIRAIGGATVYIGEGVTSTAAGVITTLLAVAGTVKCKSAVGILTNRGATYYQEAGAVTTANVYGGTVYCNGDGTFTTSNIYSGATLDLSKNPNIESGVTITTVNIYGTGEFNDPNNAAAVNTVIQLQGTDGTDASVNFGFHRKITTAAI